MPDSESVAVNDTCTEAVWRYSCADGEVRVMAGAIESIMNVLETPGVSALPALSVARARTVVVPCAATENGPL